MIQIRTFSKSYIRFSDNESPSTSSIRPFTQPTNETDSFLDYLLIRDLSAIEQLDHIINDTRDTIRMWNNDTHLTIDHTADIQELMSVLEIDVQVRERHIQSAEIIGSIQTGVEPPINNMAGWTNLRDDLDNSQESGLDDLREYVRNTIHVHITTPWMQEAAELMRTHRDNLPEDRSRDNSECEYTSNESGSVLDSGSSVYESAGSNQNESESSSDLDSDYYQSANSYQHDSESSSDSDSNDNIPNNAQISNSNINESEEENNLSDSISSDNQQSNEHANENESKNNLDKKLITDDAVDLSDTFHMLFDENPVENKSTIDFVLQKQQEEMPDIMDSDGGE